MSALKPLVSTVTKLRLESADSRVVTEERTNSVPLALAGIRVDYYLSESDRELIRVTEREVLLALVFATGEVRIKVADATSYPGHAEWAKRDQIDLASLSCAFSIIVKGGEVTGLFSSSQMNRTPDWRLDDVQLAAIRRLLPLSPDFKLY